MYINISRKVLFEDAGLLSEGKQTAYIFLKKMKMKFMHLVAFAMSIAVKLTCIFFCFQTTLKTAQTIFSMKTSFVS